MSLTREVRSSKSFFFESNLGLGLGDSMHELHKGSEELIQIYVVVYAILGLRLGNSMHELNKESEKFQIYFFLMPFWI